MKQMQDMYTNQTFRYLDHTTYETLLNHPYDAILSFAMDDALALSVSDGTSHNAMRLWIHDKTIVLGIPDTRLPYIDEGLRFLRQAGYQVIVRNSGGLAVALDESVLNISLILANEPGFSIHDGYETMVTFIKKLFAPITEDIEAFEIVGSYCPGDYDLSINGRKFAGISQRRVRNGIAVQIYLDINGDSAERATIVRDFYKISAADADLKTPPPEVQPEKMASIAELTGATLSMADIKRQTLSVLQEMTGNVVVAPDLTEDEQVHFAKRYDQIMKRNEAIQATL